MGPSFPVFPALSTELVLARDVPEPCGSGFLRSRQDLSIRLGGALCGTRYGLSRKADRQRHGPAYPAGPQGNRRVARRRRAGSADGRYFPLLPAEAGPELAGLPLPAEAEPDFTALLPTEADGDLPAGVLATTP
jgi:hypothetical protein